MLRRGLCFALVLLCGVSSGVADEQPAASESAVYELRTYVTHPGRLPALHARFRDHTMRLFKKHGMTNVSYWTPLDEENTLIYVLKHDSLDAAKKSWADFRGDAEWKTIQAASEQDGKIVMKVTSILMKATDYSPKD